MTHHYDLKDIWRIKHPDTERFTFVKKTPLIQCRLDYFLISNNLEDTVTSAKIMSSYCSDHSSILLGLHHLQKGERETGYWKFNATLIHDKTYVANIKIKLNERDRYYNDLNDKRFKWELLKYEIRKYTMKYSSTKKKATVALENELIK